MNKKAGSLQRIKKFEKLKERVGIIGIVMVTFIAMMFVCGYLHGHLNEESVESIIVGIVFFIGVFGFVVSYIALILYLATNEVRFNRIRKVFTVDELQDYFNEFLENDKSCIYLNLFSHGIWDRIKDNEILMKIVISDEGLTQEEIKRLQADEEVNKRHIVAAYVLRSITYVKSGRLTRNQKIFLNYENLKMIERLYNEVLRDARKENGPSNAEIISRCSAISSRKSLTDLREEGKRADKQLLNHEGVKEQISKAFLDEVKEKRIKNCMFGVLLVLMGLQIPLYLYKSDRIFDIVHFICTVAFEGAAVLLLKAELIKGEDIDYLY